MSGAEVVAVIGIISNIMQLTDFCARITDRAVEFAGKTADLPGSFSDLRVVLAVVRLNLRKLNKRIVTSEPDEETAATLRDLVTLIEREVTIVQTHLQKLPPPGSSWARVTVKAMISVFNEGKVKRATDNILQNVDLLSQTVTASLPTADEIANAVSERSMTKNIDRKLSMILDRMKSKAIDRARSNNAAFESLSAENRSVANQEMQIKGTTHINNTYITVNIPYEELGRQLDADGNNLMVPNRNLPFIPLKQALSNPSLPKVDLNENMSQDVVAASVVDMGLATPINSGLSTPRPKNSRSNTTKTYRHSSSKSEIITANELDSQNHFDGSTVVGSAVSPDAGLCPTLPTKPYPTPPTSPPDAASPPPAYAPRLPPRRPDRQSLDAPPLPPRPRSAAAAPAVPVEQLHETVFEFPGSVPSYYGNNSSVIETASEVGTASDIWSEAEPTRVGAQGDGTVITSPTTVGTTTGIVPLATNGVSTAEDITAMNTVNAFLRQGSSMVTKSPSEAKRAYLSAMNTAKQIVTYSPSFCVRKYRALTLASTGLALCTQDRERYLAKARGYNEQALSAANAAKNVQLELRVLLDEADLQMKEARHLEKQGKDATMRHFTAFGAYQTVASRCGEVEAAATVRLRNNSIGATNISPVATTLDNAYGNFADGYNNSNTNTDSNSRRNSSADQPADYNTHALALIGSGKAAKMMAQSAGTFRSAHGTMLAPQAYFQQAFAACRAGAEMAARRAAKAQREGNPDWAKLETEELVLLKETEEGVLRILNSDKDGVAGSNGVNEPATTGSGGVKRFRLGKDR